MPSLLLLRSSKLVILMSLVIDALGVRLEKLDAAPNRQQLTRDVSSRNHGGGGIAASSPGSDGASVPRTVASTQSFSTLRIPNAGQQPAGEAAREPRSLAATPAEQGGETGEESGGEWSPLPSPPPARPDWEPKPPPPLPPRPPPFRMCLAGFQWLCIKPKSTRGKVRKGVPFVDGLGKPPLGVGFAVREATEQKALARVVAVGPSADGGGTICRMADGSMRPGVCDGNFRQGELDLGDRQISGTLPTQVAQISGLSAAYLFDNRISGTLPPILAQMPSLLSLDLDENAISGTLHTSTLAGMSQLEFLRLERMQISGTIPTQLGLLTALQSLALNANRISGTIPSELGGISADCPPP